MTASSSASKKVKKNDRWIPWYFVAFFLVIAILDGIFVTIAIKTQRGVVTENAYEKGLAYNSILQKAAKQKNLGLNQRAKYKNGLLSWYIHDKNGEPIQNAEVTANFFRPVQSGHDFKVELKQTSSGVFEARPAFPLPGAWTVTLEARWQSSRYETTIDLIAP